MHELPDPEWYLDNVLVHAESGVARALPKGAAFRWQQWWRRQRRDDELVQQASRHGFVLTATQLRDAGITRSSIRHAVARGRWTAPQRGFVTPVLLGDGADGHTVGRRVHAVSATAAAQSRPGLVVSERSAAILHGLPTMSVPDRPRVTLAPGDGPPDRVGVRPARHVYEAGLTGAAVTPWFGVPVTTVGRTLVDLGRHDRRDALIAADAALHEGLITRGVLDAEMRTATGWPGVRQARDVLALANGLAESPLESLVRLALHDAGFPPPELQVAIGGYRVDLCWPDRRLILEIDGLGKYSDETWREEKRREQILRALGYRVERVTWDDLFRRWPTTVSRLRDDRLPRGSGRYARAGSDHVPGEGGIRVRNRRRSCRVRRRSPSPARTDRRPRAGSRV